MLALISPAVLFLGALIILILRRTRPGVGYAWLTGVLSALLASAFLLFLRWRLPQQVVVQNWLPLSQFTDSPILGLDSISWLYAMSLGVLALGTLLTASARLQRDVNPAAWAGILGILAVAMLAVYAANLLSLVLTWTLMDLMELVILQANSQERRLGLQTVTAFAVRVSGSFLVLTAILLARGQNLPPTFASLTTRESLLLLIACGLRLGVLPLHLTAVQGSVARRGLGTALRMASAASVLPVLARLPAGAVPANWQGGLLTLSALAVLYGASAWLAAPDVLTARPFWLIATAGMAVTCVLHGQPLASLAWGVLLILPGAVFFLYSASQPGTVVFPLIALAGMSGLPFTPLAAGWSGILPRTFSPLEWAFLFPLPLLMLGALRFSLMEGENLHQMERWMQVVYPLGLMVLILGYFLAGVLGLALFPTRESLIGGGMTLALFALGFGLSTLARRRFSGLIESEALRRSVARAGAFLADLFGLMWLYRFIGWLYQRVAGVFDLFTSLLEGSGGMLWVFVLLALFISLIRAEVAR
ncbi:hypothetical protein [Anaerolinea sp.]|uniref:hypothetical protein n=1 Tax=Anaerolinea sp. TaxID=1872519 RepID=UPI002ACE03AF|nr:hypothetical protein [Anaerolinea sp.]